MRVNEISHAHESSGIAVGVLLRIGAVIVGAIAVIAVIIGLSLRYWVEPHHVQAVRRAGVRPPAPRLQSAPQRALAAERQQTQQQLAEWRWVDSTHTFAEIPIERAMQLYVEQRGPGSAQVGGSP